VSKPLSTTLSPGIASANAWKGSQVKASSSGSSHWLDRGEAAALARVDSTSTVGNCTAVSTAPSACACPAAAHDNVAIVAHRRRALEARRILTALMARQ
jgi:hypothetical protein